MMTETLVGWCTFRCDPHAKTTVTFTVTKPSAAGRAGPGAGPASGNRREASHPGRQVKGATRPRCRRGYGITAAGPPELSRRGRSGTAGVRANRSGDPGASRVPGQVERCRQLGYRHRRRLEGQHGGRGDMTVTSAGDQADGQDGPPPHNAASHRDPFTLAGCPHSRWVRWRWSDAPSSMIFDEPSRGLGFHRGRREGLEFRNWCAPNGRCRAPLVHRVAVLACGGYASARPSGESIISA